MQPFIDANLPTIDPYPDTPRHGFQGDRGTAKVTPTVPAALTIALSREAGARGGTIARRVARKLDWPVYDQELLEYMAQDTVARQGLQEDLSPAAVAWIEANLHELSRRQNLSQSPAIMHLARGILTLGAAGSAVLIGRGAGCILPHASTLNVRLVAPLPHRIAYMSQWLRLSEAEAADKVQQQDQRRAEFLSAHFNHDPKDLYQYDLVLNTSLLGEDACAELIALAARARSAEEPSAN